MCQSGTDVLGMGGRERSGCDKEQQGVPVSTPSSVLSTLSGARAVKATVSLAGHLFRKRMPAPCLLGTAGSREGGGFTDGCVPANEWEGTGDGEQACGWESMLGGSLKLQCSSEWLGRPYAPWR